MRATRCQRDDQNLSKVVLPTCHGVSAVEPRPTARGGTCSALAHSTTAPSPCCEARAPWAVGRNSTGRKARGTRATGLNAVAKTSRRTCCQPATVLVRSSPGRQRGKERAPRWSTTQPRQIRAARRVLRGRPAESPQGEKHAGRAPRDSNAVVVRTCRRPCCQPATVFVRSSLGWQRGEECAPRWPTTQPRQVCAAQRVLRGRSAESPQGEKRAGRAPRDSNAMTKTSQRPCYQPATVLVRSIAGRQLCGFLQQQTILSVYFELVTPPGFGECVGSCVFFRTGARSGRLSIKTPMCRYTALHLSCSLHMHYICPLRSHRPLSEVFCHLPADDYADDR